MNLDRMAAVVRPRSPWEAIDLGMTLVKAWWLQLAPCWLVVVLPIWMLTFGLTGENRGLAFFLLWWLRPLFDSLSLFVLSRALFAQRSTLGEVLAALPSRWLSLAPAYLFVERLDPARSFHLPVRQLEGLTTSDRWRRQSLLNRQGHVQAILLTFTCLLLELCLFLALWALLDVLVPESVAPAWGALFEAYMDGEPVPWAYHFLWGLLSYLAYTVSAWLYVACGFTLYLNRRSTLEGWDIEIAFKRLAKRLVEAERNRSRQVTRGVGAALLLLIWLGSPAQANSAAAATTDPQATIEKVLADPEFGRTEKARVWRWRSAGEEIEEPQTPSGFSLAWLGPVFEVLLWGLVGLGAAMLLLYWLRNRGSGSAEDPDDTVLPEFLSRAGKNSQPQPLPADVPGAALRLAEEGRLVEALSLLYRAALLRLAKAQATELEVSWTEGECLRRLSRRAAAGTADFLSALTRVWQDAAYAQRPPSREQVDQLCDAFRRHIAMT